jgi:hypothetical protein
MTIGLKKNWEMHHIHIKTAYLHGRMDCDIFMSTPDGVKEEKNKILLIVGGLYGTKQGGRQWNLQMNAELTRMGFVQVRSEHSIYVHKDRNDEIVAMLGVYVDDILIMCETDFMQRIKDKIQKV